MKRFKFIFTFALIVSILAAQSPKREIRATWLTTVWQIDWPASVIVTTGNTTQINAQKDLMIRILDSLASANMNAVCFQVRSRCDAMYNSAYEPWSTDLVSYRGQNPGYDPLQFVIDEGHKRGIEVHAWLNPYRYETQSGQWTGQAGDYRTAHPDWILSYASGTSILDPGRPEVVGQIKRIVGDIIQKYDVDGIIFDDYFYAYGGTSTTLDAATQALYKPADMDLGDWRRANINKMVAAVYDTIQQVKPYVRFGVSPFGIWTTDKNVALKEDIELPEGITGGNMYAEIYCDPVAWLKQGTVDYISPQLYWPTGGSQDYGTLSPWWSNLTNRFGKHFYASQDIAGLQSSSYAPVKAPSASNIMLEYDGSTVNTEGMSVIEQKNAAVQPAKVPASNFTQEQIGLQISINRSSDKNGAPGSIFFSTRQLYQTKGFINYLKKYQFTHKALVPPIDWKQNNSNAFVSNISLNGNTLTWNAPSVPNVKYAIYAVPDDKINTTGNFSSSNYLLGVSYNTSFTIPLNISTVDNTFAIAVLDRYGNESPVKVMGQNEGIPVSVNLISPLNNSSEIKPFNFSWQADSSVDSYILEIAEDINFTRLFCSRELTTTTISTSHLDALTPNKTYYWRVKTRKPNTSDGVSEVRTITPLIFSIINPVTGSINTSITPEFQWLEVNKDSTYLFEVATSNQFAPTTIVYSQSTNANSLTIPHKVLYGSTTYYARVTVSITGIKTVSRTVAFTTLDVVPDVPAFISPVMNSTVFGTEIKLEWSEGVTSGYRLEMSKDASFPVRNTTIKTLTAYTNQYTFTGLASSNYYFRVRASYAQTNTDWSDTLKVILKEQTGIDDQDMDKWNYKLLYKNSNEITLKINTTGHETVSISIYSLSGRKLKELCSNESLDSGENTLNYSVTDLAKGVYLINISTKFGSRIIKYIK
ncbi:MAG: family 10 glycosylhydrolase [Paludibacter sp.]|nr:family 10 glycosylhydrolase [Paludibacter sp.]